MSARSTREEWTREIVATIATYPGQPLHLVRETNTHGRVVLSLEVEGKHRTAPFAVRIGPRYLPMLRAVIDLLEEHAQPRR